MRELDRHASMPRSGGERQGEVAVEVGGAKTRAAEVRAAEAVPPGIASEKRTESCAPVDAVSQREGCAARSTGREARRRALLLEHAPLIASGGAVRGEGGRVLLALEARELHGARGVRGRCTEAGDGSGASGQRGPLGVIARALSRSCHMSLSIRRKRRSACGLICE